MGLEIHGTHRPQLFEERRIQKRVKMRCICGISEGTNVCAPFFLSYPVNGVSQIYLICRSFFWLEFVFRAPSASKRQHGGMFGRCEFVKGGKISVYCSDWAGRGGEELPETHLRYLTLYLYYFCLQKQYEIFLVFSLCIVYISPLNWRLCDD